MAEEKGFRGMAGKGRTEIASALARLAMTEKKGASQ
jgi:hypothetical protein